MTAKITRAFVLCAGKGERMRPLTDTLPKPLIEVGGVAMLDRVLSSLKAAGVEEVVVNLHYLGEKIAAHLENYRDMKIILSREETLLETGGGIFNALHHFHGAPFYVLNGDTFWRDVDGISALDRMAAVWDAGKMDILLMLHNLRDIPGGYAGKPDYLLRAEFGQPVFAKGAEKMPDAVHVFGGMRIIHPRIFDKAAEGFYSFLDFMRAAERDGTLYALEHKGPWYHVGTPAELEQANRLLAEEDKIAVRHA